VGWRAGGAWRGNVEAGRRAWAGLAALAQDEPDEK